MIGNEIVNQIQAGFVSNLRAFRKLAMLSQIELAQRAGLSQGYVADLERGAKFPSPTTMEKLCTALDIRPYQLFLTAEDLQEASGASLAADYLEKLRDQLESGIDEAIHALAPPPETSTDD